MSKRTEWEFCAWCKSARPAEFGHVVDEVRLEVFKGLVNSEKLGKVKRQSGKEKLHAVVLLNSGAASSSYLGVKSVFYILFSKYSIILWMVLLTPFTWEKMCR